MLKLILLPGMDGTGKLFEPFTRELGKTFEVEAVRYPLDQFLSYSELEIFVQAFIPKSEPFVLLAESYSTPVAVMCAAGRPANLKGLAICAGFVSSPLRGWRRLVFSRLAPLLFGRTLPDAAAKWFLVGSNAAPELLAAVRSAISSVAPTVLARRVRAILACDARAEFARVRVPILYLQAGQDRLVGSGCLDEIRRIKPDLTEEEIPGPHLLLQREPEQSAAAIKAWLRKITQCGPV